MNKSVSVFVFANVLLFSLGSFKHSIAHVELNVNIVFVSYHNAATSDLSGKRKKSHVYGSFQ